MELNPSQKSRLLRKLLSQLGQALVVVEGDKDERALREAGIGARVFKMRGLNANKTAEEVENRIQADEKIVLLVDFDEEGRRKEKELRQALAERKIGASSSARNNFKQLFRINTVEQLPSALRRIEEEIGDN